MKALILAGGFGTRISKVVFDRPKSMIPVAGIPFLEHQIRFLKEFGIKEIILCVSYMSDQIKSYFGDGRDLGINITYSEEEIPLGTAGAIKKAEKYIKDTFLVLNGDTYFQIDVNRMLEFHKNAKSMLTLSLTKAQHALHYGKVKMQDNKIMEVLDKEADSNGFVNAGVYIFEPEMLRFIEPNINISLEKAMLPRFAQEGLLHGFYFDGYFMDIARPETYEQFKKDVLNLMILNDKNTLRDALRKIHRSGISLVLVVDDSKRFLGVLSEKEIKSIIVSGGNLEELLQKHINSKVMTAKASSTREELLRIFALGNEYIPIIDESGMINDIEFFHEEIKSVSYPILRGRVPLRISFAGGGTDIPYFFDKYGGAVVNATIDKYCFATLVKRADKKIIIDTDLTPGIDVYVDSIEDLKYDGKFDLIKAVINIMKPYFGFELYMHNDIPPGRGLGSSASAAVLAVGLLNNLMDTRYNDYKIAEIAHKAEIVELKIKGGWQDQYATVTGGFNFMEFNADKTIVYPLRLKSDLINELQSHLLLCYTGKAHFSSEVHESQESSFISSEDEITALLTALKKKAIDIRDFLLTDRLEDIGRLLHDSWEIKKKLSKVMSNPIIDMLYDIGLKNGAYGGKLLGAGSGGYILFFYQPKKRNILKSALQEAGGEITNFNFEFDGIKIWQAKNKF